MLADYNRPVLQALYSWFIVLCELQALSAAQNDLRLELLAVVNEVTAEASLAFLEQPHVYHFNRPFELLIKYYIVSPKKATDLQSVWELIENIFIDTFHYEKHTG
jgi:hypothetical protein